MGYSEKSAHASPSAAAGQSLSFRPRNRCRASLSRSKFRCQLPSDFLKGCRRSTDSLSGSLQKCYNAYNSYVAGGRPYESDSFPSSSACVCRQKVGKRLKRMANRHGWTPSDASARLVEEGLIRSEFAFIDFRDSPVGRQAYIQGSTLAVWEVMLLVRGYKADSPPWPTSQVAGGESSSSRQLRESVSGRD